MASYFVSYSAMSQENPPQFVFSNTYLTFDRGFLVGEAHKRLEAAGAEKPTIVSWQRIDGFVVEEFDAYLRGDDRSFNSQQGTRIALSDNPRVS